MKALALLLLLCATAYGAETVTTNVVGGITTKIYEHTDKAGKLVWRREVSYRGLKEVMEATSLLKEDGTLADHAYSYFAGGKGLFFEGEKDITVVLPDSGALEIFTRGIDGSIEPASTERVQLVKGQIAVTDKFINKLFSSNHLSDGDINKLLKENRENVRILEKRELGATNAAGDITTKISERQGADKKPDRRIESFYRGKAKVLQVVSRPNKKGIMSPRSRTYILNGKSLATETDADGDGKYERLIVYSPNSDDIEIFKRDGDGTVTPASTAQVDLVKKESAIALESRRKLSEYPEMLGVDSGKSIEESRRKIQDLNKTNRTQ